MSPWPWVVRWASVTSVVEFAGDVLSTVHATHFTCSSEDSCVSKPSVHERETHGINTRAVLNRESVAHAILFAREYLGAILVIVTTKTVYKVNQTYLFNLPRSRFFRGIQIALLKSG
jgi:hypothetical protein